METITVHLSQECLQTLRERALRLQVSPEELARVGIEELLTRPDPAFEAAVRVVLRKNAELYRRLA